MTAPSRLLSVRLQGFKSFAERTHVVFGPGISAVVGPNGSGKSNLADALRWALGEQGRALRTRKAEDVIWAGSERRPALGMADVQLTLDNADGLLPVEFGVVELGRRLYRSGESEYVVNRQRVRLRDLVDLLDTAHLAENTFLFIGQGMVDQALALRPEERRPLFEEVAGVRRHERRRRRAEDQLVESEANLARVDDLVAELRPQVRRLAAQAEQQASRRDAGDELAAALLVAAHGRWHAAASQLDHAAAALDERRAAVEGAMTELASCEDAAAGFTDRLAERAAAAAEARRAVDEARERLTGARLASAAVDAEANSLERDGSRLGADRVAVERDLATARRSAAVAGPGVDATLEAELREAEAALAAAVNELALARAATHSADAARAAARRAEASREADLDLARRRRLELEREAVGEAERAAHAEANRAAAAEAHAAATAELARARDAERQATRSAEAAQAAAEAARLAAAAAAAQAAALEPRLPDARARLEVLRARLASETGTGLGAAARSAGGRQLAEGLVVEPAFEATVAAALGARGSAYVVGRAAVAEMTALPGTVVVAEVLRAARADRSTGERSIDDFVAAVRAAGGGRLVEAVRSDPTAAVRRLLERAVWLPDVAACLRLQPSLPTGWIAVTRDGGAVVGEATVDLRPDDGLLARRSESAALARELEALERSVRAAGRARDDAAATAERALAGATSERAAAEAARDARHTAEAAEASAGRRAEAAAREAIWLAAQAERLNAAALRAAEAVAALEAAAPTAPPAGGGGSAGLADGSPAAGEGSAPVGLAGLESRVAELRARRDRLDATWRSTDAARREAERARSRGEAAAAIGERRLAEIEAALVALARRDAELDHARSEAAAALERATSANDVAAARLEELLALDAEDRGRLGGAERAAAAARDTLRAMQEALRLAEHQELEGRLGLESLREQLLVELAGLGELGLRHLAGDAAAAADGPPAERAGGPLAESHPSPRLLADEESTEPGETPADVARLEAALDTAASRWAATPPPADVPPPGRLASLRRRFHELGAANPYALEEHAALAARLSALESQRDDLGAAVGRTRDLIAELDGLIASQFQATLGALERAFDARFRQLFGGGFARLTLTEPGDLSATGIEIIARPPGKKPQALSLLSGGERALTAVALLFAMLEVRPVPFCVLDEVDAALDEANIGRFTEALRELATATQFVVITHNRGTIETADALYGVTVGDDSVSRVISLRLEDATALAAEASDGAGGTRRQPIIPAGLDAADRGTDERDGVAVDGLAEAAG